MANPHLLKVAGFNLPGDTWWWQYQDSRGEGGNVLVILRGKENLGCARYCTASTAGIDDVKLDSRPRESDQPRDPQESQRTDSEEELRSGSHHDSVTQNSIQRTEE